MAWDYMEEKILLRNGRESEGVGGRKKNFPLQPRRKRKVFLVEGKLCVSERGEK